MGLTNTPSDLLPGTLELLILKALRPGARHGYGIVEHLRVVSDDVLKVGESALYPALQRLLLNGWVRAEGPVSDTRPPPPLTCSMTRGVLSILPRGCCRPVYLLDNVPRGAEGPPR